MLLHSTLFHQLSMTQGDLMMMIIGKFNSLAPGIINATRLSNIPFLASINFITLLLTFCI